ncbi:MAG TPA: PP2C family protein-serine/threonine phosphatase, partial [Bacteroidia bacterium]|nr:PP2C family protein-serine/threonine phosphatase [Bacteroidia bacterium]
GSKPKIKDIKLSALLEVTKAINSNHSVTQLLEIFEHTLRNQLNIGKLILFSKDEKWKILLKYGVGNDYNNVNVEKDFANLTEITTIDSVSQSLKKTFEIIIPIFHKTIPLAYVLIGDLNEDKVEVSPTIKHLPFIQTLTNIIIVAIENKKLAKENIRQAAIQRELDLASEMQSMLFPTTLPHDKQLDIAAVYLPHHQVGGDYYDFIRLNENEIAFCMADVSGKGVAAALLMSNFQANLRILFNHTTSLADLVKELNAKVMANAKGEKFITLFIAKYNMVTRVLNYINAGHNPPLISSGKNTNLLKIGCTGLGMFEELQKVKEGIINVSPKTTILCYTDGVVELENNNGKEFGIENLTKTLIENPNLDMTNLNQLVVKKLNNHKENQPYIDDITLFSCRLF